MGEVNITGQRWRRWLKKQAQTINPIWKSFNSTSLGPTTTAASAARSTLTTTKTTTTATTNTTFLTRTLPASRCPARKSLEHCRTLGSAIVTRPSSTQLAALRPITNTALSSASSATLTITEHFRKRSKSSVGGTREKSGVFGEMTTAVSSALRSPKKTTPSETWDDDFEFTKPDIKPGIHRTDKENTHGTPQKTHKRGVSLDNDRDKARWNGIIGDQAMQDWPEPGPSRAFIKIPLTPSSAASSSPRRPLNLRARAEEGDDDNWDDDFVDKLDSPARQLPRTPFSSHKASPRYNSRMRRLGASTPPNETNENWDEDFELGSTAGGSAQASPISKRSRDPSEAGTNWDYSSDEGEESDFGREITNEEDKTVTAHARRRPLIAIAPLPLPSLEPPSNLDTNHIHIPDSSQVAPHPRSPTISVFSIPATVTTASGRDSVMFGSTAHLGAGLRRTHSAGSSSAGFGRGQGPTPNLLRRYPAPPPVPRERRRLRKKSRPPKLEGDVMELDDRFEAGRPSTSSSTDGNAGGVWRPQTPPPRSSICGPTMPVSGTLSYATPSSTAAENPGSASRTVSGGGSAPTTTMAAPPTSINVNSSPLSQVQGIATTNKSPLLSRIGSMKRWGVGVRRKRASGLMQAGVSVSGSSASGRASEDLDEEGEVGEHERTPRASMTTTISSGVSPRATPASAAGRFFRSRTVAENTIADGQELRRDASAEGGSTESGGGSGRGGSGNGNLLASPTKARFLALGSRLIPGGSKTSALAMNTSGAGPSDRSRDDGEDDVTLTVKNARNARMHAHDHARSTSPSPSPAPGSVPASRRYSQLAPQMPSSLALRPKAPRHVSGPASSGSRTDLRDGIVANSNLEGGSGRVNRKASRERDGMGVANGSMRRTVSGVPSSSSSASIGSAAGDRLKNTSASTGGDAHGHGRSKSKDAKEKDKDKDGGRGFMGSMRRISLVGGGSGQKQHRRSKSGSGNVPEGAEHSMNGVAPPLPTSMFVPAQTQTQTSLPPLLPPLQLPISQPLTSAMKSRGIDLSSPVEFSASAAAGFSSSLPTRSGFSRVPSASHTMTTLSSLTTSRRPSEPTLSHSKSSSFVTRSTSGNFAPSNNGNSSSNRTPSAASRLATASPSPSQVNSLGRATQPPSAPGSGGGGASRGSPVSAKEGSSPVPRRNSLGDLKIPSRISKAQDGLKRDLGRVKEFAGHVEQMKELRSTYFALIDQIQAVIDAAPHPSRAATPLLHLTQPQSRSRSNTNPPPPQLEQRRIMIAFQTIDSKYRIAWECADLLIELGTGAIGENASPNKRMSGLPPVPTLTPGASLSTNSKHRERAITLAGDEGKPPQSLQDAQLGSAQSGPPPPPASWRASTGRNDLNSRQLFLLKEMLNNGDSTKDTARLDMQMGVGAEESRAPTPWMGHFEGMESSLTLPTEESEMMSTQMSGKKENGQPAVAAFPTKKKKGAKLGMAGLRDMLRSLKRNQSRATNLAHDGAEVASNESSSVGPSGQVHMHSPVYGQTLPLSAGRLAGRKRSKTSIAPESVRSASGNDFPNAVPYKSSPRRPSLASLFRIGQKQKANGSASASTTDLKVEQTEDTGTKQHKEVAPDAGAADANRSSSTSRTCTTEDDESESDWDRMDSSSDINVPVENSSGQDGEKSATLRGRNKNQLRQQLEESSSPVSRTGSTSKNLFSAFSNASQGSFRDSPEHSFSQYRSPRLSNVDENGVSKSGSGRHTPSSPCIARDQRAKSKEPKSSTNTRPSSSGGPRSKPLDVVVQPIPDLKLAMTPENIKPLLENARVVASQLTECISETKDLLASSTESKSLQTPSAPQALAQ